MRIQIDLSPIDCEKILHENGYVIEEIEVLTDYFYTHGSDKEYDDVRKQLVAYKKDNKPPKFNERHYLENVLRELVNKKFIKLMCE